MIVAAINGWSLTEVLGIVGCMVVMLIAAIYSRPLARAIIGMSSSYGFPPVSLPREDRPERIRQLREAHESQSRIGRIAILVAAAMTWIFGIAALIDGREGPLFDALF